MSPLPLGMVAASGTGKTPVAIISGTTPSPQTLTGGLTVVYGNGTTSANWTNNSDSLRMAWPSWSDSTLYTVNTYNLTGAKNYVADVSTSGMNSAYGYFSIGYPNSSGGYTAPYGFPRATGRQTYTVNLTDTPGTGKIVFNGGNTFGDVIIYSLIFNF